jgi:putative endopeptidase
MRNRILQTVAAAALIMAMSCSQKQSASLCPGPDPLKAHLDSSVRPGDDFFLYANGRWFRENPIPADEQSNGLWQMIGDTIKAQIRNICESSAALSAGREDGARRKIGDFFSSGMDSIAINAKGLSDIGADLERIDGVRDLRELARAAAEVHAVAGSPLFGFWIGQDDRLSGKYAIFISQGGLSLPDRRFYFDTDPRAVSVRRDFVRHVERMYSRMGLGDAEAAKAATRLMKLETALAKASRKREDTRDPLKNYNKMSFADLCGRTPDLDWPGFMTASGLTAVDTVVVGQPEFLDSLNARLKDIPIVDWRNYLKYHFVRGLARYLDDETYLESFRFYSGVLRGVEQPKPRWKRVVEQTDASLGELIGQVYVVEYLPPGTKQKLVEIGKAVRKAYAARIRGLDWMSDPTKQKALEKLGTVIMKVGYPDRWKDLSDLRVDRSSYVRNGISANRWEFRYMVSRFGRPVDRTEWDMQPQTYNAYYNPSNNEICVPGCNILVPGYERVLADDAILYSIIGGSTFGHEITHGFDDQGCKYDERGNLNNWWTAEDSVQFCAKARSIVRQFNGYVAVDTLHINGEMTQGENIADLAGVLIGYDAFRNTRQVRKNEIISALTPDQRYFLGYAMAWMINNRPEAVANQVRSDVHSPARFRVIGPLSDIPEFYAAFGVKEGDAMWRPDSLRVRIW